MGAKKNFVLDTNVILHDYKCIENFQENDIYLPIVVLEELDKFKKGSDQINYNAREFVRELDLMTSNDLFLKGASLGPGLGTLHVVTGDKYQEKIALSFPDRTPDHRILSCTLSVAEKTPKMQTILVTKDVNLRMKARALGMYMADYNVLKAIGKPTAEVEGVIAKLATDLNVSFVLDILKEQAPKDAPKEQLQAFMNAQEDKIIEKMAAENKIDAEVEMLGAASAEYACLVANPTLVVQGDATSAGLSANMEKRVSMLEEVVADLAAYYPDLKQLGETIAPLKEKVASIQSARAANAEIMGIRDALLK